MSRVPLVLLFALAVAATGCETGSMHENKTDTGVMGQNVGESSNQAGPVPGSETGTDQTARHNPEKPDVRKPAAASDPSPTQKQ